MHTVFTYPTDAQVLNLHVCPASLCLALHITLRIFLLMSFPLHVQVSSESFCTAPYMGEVSLKCRYYDTLLTLPGLSGRCSDLCCFCNLQRVTLVSECLFELLNLELLQVKCVTPAIVRFLRYSLLFSQPVHLLCGMTQQNPPLLDMSKEYTPPWFS